MSEKLYLPKIEKKNYKTAEFYEELFFYFESEMNSGVIGIPYSLDGRSLAAILETITFSSSDFFSSRPYSNWIRTGNVGSMNQWL